jgi:parvulin-like peptidyl-prolyl isomerase
MFLSFYGKSFAQDKIVAVVNDEVITQKDFDEYLKFSRLELEQQYKGKELEDKVSAMKHDMINRLIEDRLILQEAKLALEQARKDKDPYAISRLEVDPARIKIRIDDIKKHYFSDKEFQAALAQQGMNQADLEEKIKEQIMTYSIIEVKVKNNITVNPREVTDYYQQNPEKMKLPEQREFVSLSFDDRATADEVYAKAKSGEGLETTALAYDRMPDRLNVYKGAELRKDIETVVFQLNLGEISKPVKIENQYYIFRVDKITPPRAQTLAEAQDKIGEFLVNSKMQKALTSWLDEIKKKSYINISQN